MPEARTDTTNVRPQEAAASVASGTGKHRGAAAVSEQQTSGRGRHRRPSGQKP
jgi:hypothetical protein